MRHVFPGVAVTLAAGLALSGCGGGKQTKLVCPATFIAPDTDKVAVFKPGGSTISDVRYGVQISNLHSKCDRADKATTHGESLLLPRTGSREPRAGNSAGSSGRLRVEHSLGTG